MLSRLREIKCSCLSLLQRMKRFFDRLNLESSLTPDICFYQLLRCLFHPQLLEPVTYFEGPQNCKFRILKKQNISSNSSQVILLTWRNLFCPVTDFYRFKLFILMKSFRYRLTTILIKGNLVRSNIGFNRWAIATEIYVPNILYLFLLVCMDLPVCQYTGICAFLMESFCADLLALWTEQCCCKRQVYRCWSQR